MTIIFKNFFDSSVPFIIVKSMFAFGTIMFCLLAVFIHMDLLAYGLMGAGLLVLTSGIERKVEKNETKTLIVAIVAALIFFMMARYTLVTADYNYINR